MEAISVITIAMQSELCQTYINVCLVHLSNFCMMHVLKLECKILNHTNCWTIMQQLKLGLVHKIRTSDITVDAKTCILDLAKTCQPFLIAICEKCKWMGHCIRIIDSMIIDAILQFCIELSDSSLDCVFDKCVTELLYCIYAIYPFLWVTKPWLDIASAEVVSKCCKHTFYWMQNPSSEQIASSDNIYSKLLKCRMTGWASKTIKNNSWLRQ